MSTDNPSITASDIVTDVELRLGSPGIATATYLPWISYAYQKTYQALVNAGQRVKEELFGNQTTFDLTAGVGEYTLSTELSRFGGVIKVELKYGKTGDDWVRATRIESVSDWRIDNNDSTSYRAKDSALYYLLQDTIGFLPIPPASETDQTPQAKVFYIKRPYQIDAGGDVIDIPYRFIYPVSNYVQAKAVEAENEDYGQAAITEQRFTQELDDIAVAAESEFGEAEGVNRVKVASNSSIFSRPF